MERWLPEFDLIKVSRADLAFLYETTEEELDVDATATDWLGAGVTLVIVTAGSEGSIAYRSGKEPIRVALEPVKLVDAVGAGDSYMGSLLVYLQKQEALNKDVLTDMLEWQLREAMEFAAKVAGINCTRAGCDPPTIFEMQ